MKTDELRIGNLVYAKNEEIVKGIKDGYVWFDKERNLSIELCLPIQLTEERLLKFGFTRCGYEGLFWCHEKLKGLEFGGINWADAEFPEYQFLNYKVGEEIYHIHYTHQLQNLYFALTNEELILQTWTQN